MAKKINTYFFFSLIFLSFIFVSCRKIVPIAHVIAGNATYRKGEYQRAILQYLDALEQENRSVDVLYYNLANVYDALGEGDAAQEIWERAEKNTEDQEIIFRIAFNRGVLFYRRGRYDEAYQFFKEALILHPNDIETKINLEESLLRIPATLSPESKIEQEKAPQDTTENEKSVRLLDYIKRKGENAWSSEVEENTENNEDW